MEKIYTTREVAEMLHMNVQTIRKYTRDGDLKSFKVGSPKKGKIKIKESDLDAFIKQRMQTKGE